jgi:hypothetical protein
MKNKNNTPTPQCIVIHNLSRDNIFCGSLAECEAWLDRFCKGYERPEKVRSRFFIWKPNKS